MAANRRMSTIGLPNCESSTESEWMSQCVMGGGPGSTNTREWRKSRTNAAASSPGLGQCRCKCMPGTGTAGRRHDL